MMPHPPIKKAIIPVAGLGTRMLPASKAIPKEMLTIVDKPAIQYVVEEAIYAGIKQIILVTRSGKESIENHFDSNYELEHMLNQKGKNQILEDITNMVPQDVEILSVRQDAPKGLGHAVLCARHICEGQPFAVMLPDVLIFDKDNATDLSQMVNRYELSGHGQVMVEEVLPSDAQAYGIAECSNNQLAARSGSLITRMIEKPKPGESESNMAVVGRYILPASIMDILKQTAPGDGNEVQLTDAMQKLLTSEPLDAYKMGGRTFDCGNKLGYLMANLYAGLQHPELASDLSDFIKRRCE